MLKLINISLAISAGLFAFSANVLAYTNPNTSSPARDFGAVWQFTPDAVKFTQYSQALSEKNVRDSDNTIGGTGGGGGGIGTFDDTSDNNASGDAVVSDITTTTIGTFILNETNVVVTDSSNIDVTDLGATNNADGVQDVLGTTLNSAESPNSSFRTRIDN